MQHRRRSREGCRRRHNEAPVPRGKCSIVHTLHRMVGCCTWTLCPDSRRLPLIFHFLFPLDASSSPRSSSSPSLKRLSTFVYRGRYRRVAIQESGVIHLNVFSPSHRPWFEP
ncbi:hypothetical protein AAFF_G00385530 [Aldrovandia affinis]|uniref:Uncharacterized protein n=1 Tax=Aldrovandia affinis TaxID=143900 RepID=A0AAD7WLJ1_9TELE|nr:hypothetical protein AAFF_G00385530 [Aldrovandia affinis]